MRNFSSLLVLALCFLSLPFVASATTSVQINEIAWMGTTVSANHEWIELYNGGDGVVDLSGWTLSAADGSLRITLSGAVSSGGYFLLERSSDETVPSVSADLIYTGALSNSGETLTLYNAGGAPIDVVEGGVDWQNIGGDNTAKHTAQRLPSNNSWITAIGTPKGLNARQGGAPSTTTVSEDDSQSDPPTSLPPVYPRKEISVFAGDDTYAFIGFPVSFLGSAKGLYDEELEDIAYRWNFGDGATGEGKSVTHTYPFIGEYVVVLEAMLGSHKKTDQMIVAVAQLDTSITRTKSGVDGFVEVGNHTNREIDLSRWMLRTSTGKTFVFPDNTLLLPRKSVIFPNEMTQLKDVGMITLLSPSGAVVYQHGELPPATSLLPGIVKGAAMLKSTSLVSSPKQADLTPSSVQEKVVKDSPQTASSAAATILWERGSGMLSRDKIFSEHTKWFFALAGILLIALAGFIIARSRNDEASIANEYAIIEDIIEGEIKE